MDTTHWYDADEKQTELLEHRKQVERSAERLAEIKARGQIAFELLKGAERSIMNVRAMAHSGDFTHTDLNKAITAAEGKVEQARCHCHDIMGGI